MKNAKNLKQRILKQHLIKLNKMSRTKFNGFEKYFITTLSKKQRMTLRKWKKTVVDQSMHKVTSKW